MRKVVYEAGQISNANCTCVAENLHRFTRLENALLRAGYAPLNPAADWGAVSLGGVDYEMVMSRDRALILASDALYFQLGWKDSPGARREHKFATANGIICVEEPPEGFEASGFRELREALET